MFVLENLSFKSIIQTRKVGEESRKMDSDPPKKSIIQTRKVGEERRKMDSDPQKILCILKPSGVSCN